VGQCTFAEPNAYYTAVDANGVKQFYAGRAADENLAWVVNVNWGLGPLTIKGQHRETGQDFEAIYSDQLYYGSHSSYADATLDLGGFWPFAGHGEGSLKSSKVTLHYEDTVNTKVRDSYEKPYSYKLRFENAKDAPWSWLLQGVESYEGNRLRSDQNDTRAYDTAVLALLRMQVIGGTSLALGSNNHSYSDGRNLSLLDLQARQALWSGAALEFAGTLARLDTNDVTITDTSISTSSVTSHQTGCYFARFSQRYGALLGQLTFGQQPFADDEFSIDWLDSNPSLVLSLAGSF
jgi:hypothetical protein